MYICLTFTKNTCGWVLENQGHLLQSRLLTGLAITPLQPSDELLYRVTITNYSLNRYTWLGQK